MKFDSRGNVLINGTKGVQFVQESTDSINSGFDEVMKEGPLCKEQMRDCKFIIYSLCSSRGYCTQRSISA